MWYQLSLILCAFAIAEALLGKGKIRNTLKPGQILRTTISPIYCVINPEFDVVPTEISPVSKLQKGVVLLAQPNEFNRFLVKAAIFLYDYGSERGSRGVILERATAFSMGESSPNAGCFEANTLFMGGSDGSDTAIMLHKYDLDGFSKYIGKGIYIGGMKEARELVSNRGAIPIDFKFIFNNIEWAPGQLENEVKEGKWNLAVVPPDMILSQSLSSLRVPLWSKARNHLISIGAVSSGGDEKESNDDDESVQQELEDDDEEDEEDGGEKIDFGYKKNS